MKVEHFVVSVPRPAGPLRPAIEEALRHEGRLPLRWAIVAVEGERLVVEGARLCSPSST